MIKPDIEALGVQERICSASPVRPTGSRRGKQRGGKHPSRPAAAIVDNYRCLCLRLAGPQITGCPSTYRRFAGAAGSIEEPSRAAASCNGHGKIRP
jgi:hypothetical protein